MSITAIEEFFIPHFNSLNSEAKKRFEESEAGKEFRKQITTLSEAQQSYENSIGFWSMFLGGHEAQKQKLKESLDIAKFFYIKNFSNAEAYKAVITTISFERISEEIPALKLIEPNQAQQLGSTQAVKELFQQLDPIDAQIKQAREQLSKLDEWSKLQQGLAINSAIDELVEQKKQVLLAWEEQFSTNPAFSQYTKTIHAKQLQNKKEKYQEKIQRLSNYLTLLNYRTSATTAPLNQQLITRFNSKIQNSEVPAPLINELRDIYLNYMSEINKYEMAFINLKSFNDVQALILAEATIVALKKRQTVDFDYFFKIYANELFRYLEGEFQLINGTHLAVPQLDLKKEMINSLSYLWTNPLVQNTNNFVGRLAEAHAFIQSTNFSTQNESSFLAILDIYNYGKYYSQIAETKTIIQSLLQPFNPLITEYKDIGLYEQNVFNKFLRTLIPILIVVACVIALSLLLTPFGLPEIIFIAAIIPEIIIGLGVASLYVSSKNFLYQYAREFYYGGPYNIPEFQINERMIAAFKSEPNALGVRAFYLDAISACDLQEKEYQNKQKHNTLTQEDINNRKDNSKRRHRLNLEWYDIHSNKELSIEDAARIVLNTLSQEINEEYQSLQDSLGREREGLRESVQKITADLQNIITQQDNLDSALPLLKTTYNVGLFKRPVCLQHKMRAEEMVILRREISNPSR